MLNIIVDTRTNQIMGQWNDEISLSKTDSHALMLTLPFMSAIEIPNIQRLDDLPLPLSFYECVNNAIVLKANNDYSSVLLSADQCALDAISLDVAKNNFLKFVDDTVIPQIAVVLGSNDTKHKIHEMKVAEAREFLQATDPLPASFPLLFAEATALGLQVADVATTILNKSTDQKNLVKDLESIRLKAKATIRGALSKAEVKDAVTALNLDLHNLFESMS